MVTPYLFFDGRCEEALGFYRDALGGEIGMMMRYRDSPDPSHNPPGSDDKVMHASFKIGDSVVMASDGRCGGKPSFAGFSLSLNAPSPAAATKLFKALSAGGQVQMPLEKTFFAKKFGMVADKFGVPWMVICET